MCELQDKKELITDSESAIENTGGKKTSIILNIAYV